MSLFDALIEIEKLKYLWIERISDIVFKKHDVIRELGNASIKSLSPEKKK